MLDAPATNSSTNAGALHETLKSLEDTPIAAAMREGKWLYPAVETLHILGFVVLVGSAAMFDLRLLGLSKRIPVKDLARHLLRWSQASIFVVVPAGLALFMSDATATWQNPAFRTKLVLLAAALLNAIIFHMYTLRSVDQWNVSSATPTTAKIAAALSLMHWIGIITAGRLIAYM